MVTLSSRLLARETCRGGSLCSGIYAMEKNANTPRRYIDKVDLGLFIFMPNLLAPAGETSWPDERTVGQTGRRADGRTDGRPVERTDERTLERTDGWTDGRTVERTNGRLDGRTDGWTDGRTVERTDGRTDGWTNERTDGWMDGQLNGPDWAGWVQQVHLMLFN